MQSAIPVPESVGGTDESTPVDESGVVLASVLLASAVVLLSPVGVELSRSDGRNVSAAVDASSDGFVTSCSSSVTVEPFAHATSAPASTKKPAPIHFNDFM